MLKQRSVLLALCLLWFAAVAWAVPENSNTLPLYDMRGKPARGIVCDNLASTPAAEQNYLYLLLPHPWRFDQVEISLHNPEGSRTDSRGLNNAGLLQPLSTSEDEHQYLRYLPPLEFNFEQTPSRNIPSHITGTDTRVVVITIIDNETKGQQLTLRREIHLKRPTVILVHGINSTPSVWNGTQQRGLGLALGNRGFHQERFNHGTNDLAASRTPAGAVYFRGNGPVESAAQQLAASVETQLELRRTAGFSARRVDIVAHSYGGVITRWFIKMAMQPSQSTPRATFLEKLFVPESPAVPPSKEWYVNSVNQPEGANLYYFDKSFWEREYSAVQLPDNGVLPVRKVITIGSMWRGVPLCNYLNEIRGPAHPMALDGKRFYEAPLQFPLSVVAANVGLFADQRLQQGPNAIPTRVPSMEVMAVNSRWLQYLNETPFAWQVAYGSVAGDSNSYLPIFLSLGADPYTSLHYAQQPSWFPHLKLERIRNSRHNFSDGLVPVWSAALTGSALLVGAHHGNILSDEDTKSYVLAALSNRNLPTGEKLATQWNSPVFSRVRAGNGLEHGWRFQGGKMAPLPQDDYYQLVDKDGKQYDHYSRAPSSAVARIAPSALTH